MLCIYPSKCTHTAVNTHTVNTHTHTVNTHPEQWAAVYAAAPGEQLGVRCLVQGHLSRGIEGGERALYIHSPHLQSLLVRDSNSQPFNYESDSLQLGHDFPSLHASSVLFMHKLVWDWFYVEHPTHENMFLCRFTAAVDYLAKNVSLSTQRRMKLGDHSAVLGLLQVETGQAYWVRPLQTHLHTLSDAQTPPPSSWSRHERERLLLWFSRQETLAISFDVTFSWLWACLVPLTRIRGPCSGCRHVDGRKNAFRAFPKTYFHLAVHSRVITMDNLACFLSILLLWLPLQLL